MGTKNKPSWKVLQNFLSGGKTDQCWESMPVYTIGSSFLILTHINLTSHCNFWFRSYNPALLCLSSISHWPVSEPRTTSSWKSCIHNLPSAIKFFYIVLLAPKLEGMVRQQQLSMCTNAFSFDTEKCTNCTLKVNRGNILHRHNWAICWRHIFSYMVWRWSVCFKYNFCFRWTGNTLDSGLHLSQSGHEKRAGASAAA